MILNKYWIELPQSFNLRSSGSKAGKHVFMRHKGRGILHFSGSSKPHLRCKKSITPDFFQLPQNRAIELAYFMIEVFRLAKYCPKNDYVNYFHGHCSKFLMKIEKYCTQSNVSYFPSWAHSFSKSCKIRPKNQIQSTGQDRISESKNISQHLVIKNKKKKKHNRTWSS